MTPRTAPPAALVGWPLAAFFAGCVALGGLTGVAVIWWWTR